MYYEDGNNRKKDRILMNILLVIIICLLLFLILKIDEKSIEEESYKTVKLSTNSEENVDKTVQNSIDNVVKCVVGISKMKNNGKSIFLVESEEKLGMGSGVLITDKGYILTNEHVVGEKYSNCYVTLYDGRNYNGTVIWADKNIDMAIVKINASMLDYIKLGDSDTITLAEDVYAIGNPIGIEFERTVTKGIISGKNRTIKLSDQDIYMEDLIQTDASINVGNSGGALVNLKGELLGINTVKIDDAEKIGFAVPINIIKPIIDKLVNEGYFKEAYLGVFGYDKEVTNYLDYDLKLENGIYIAKIAEDSNLNDIGVKEGDIISRIDNIKIGKMNDLKNYIYSKKPKDIVKLEIRRNREIFEIEVELQEKK